jgi:hypothetical protein
VLIALAKSAACTGAPLLVPPADSHAPHHFTVVPHLRHVLP